MHIYAWCVRGKGIPFIQLARRSQLTALAEEAVPSNCHRNRVSSLLRGVRGRVGTQQVATDNDFSLDDGLAAKDDVRSADDLGAPRDFVAGILASCEQM